MQNGQVYAQYIPPSTPTMAHATLTVDPPAAPVRRASHPSSISTPSPTNHQRSHSQSQSQSHQRLYTYPPAMPLTGPPGVDGLPTTHMQAPLHVSTLPQAYQEQLQWQQQQQLLHQLGHGFDPHAQHVIAHAQIAPAPPLPSSHPKPRPLVPAQLQTQTNPQQQQQTQQQKMTHTPTTTSMVIPATVPVRQSQTTEQTIVHVRGQPPAPAPTAGTPLPLAMQMVATTRLREQVQTQAVPVPASVQTRTQQPAVVAGASLDATASANANASTGAGAGSAVPSPPGKQMMGPPRTLQQMPPPHQQQHQRFAVPPALAAFKVLQPAKDLLEQTWAAAIAAVQQEFAAVHAELGRSAREKQALTELLQRLQGERVQALHALHNTQTELRQCMVNFQSERRTRVHLEQRLAEMTQFIEKCTCGAAPAKKLPSTPTTMTPPPLAVLAALPSSAPSPLSSPPASVPVLTPSTEARTASPSSPPTDAIRSSVRRHERDEDEDEAVEGASAPKRRRIVRTPTPTSSPSAPVSKVVDTRETADAPAPVDKTPTAPQEQPTPEAEAPLQQQQQPEEPKTPPAAPRRKIGIQHIQLVYETVGSTLQCRMCLLRKREVDSTTCVATFPLSAAYTELVGHCEQEHDAALEALACMSPGEIAEMRQRFQAAQ
ncbi:hypothetical protein BJY52DRAFT_1278564 [Lactarius psammicola]|nr:hypothetical protein BJY52DRAFT_1278564 [Lactarius psammicola]